MPSYDGDLLSAAELLLVREPGQRGKLPAARVRRSVSTTYYALFHFLLEEAGERLLGTHNDLLQRRRIFARVFTHNGMKTALEKVRGKGVDSSVGDFLRSSSGHGPVPSPAFAQDLAIAFLDAQAKRMDADYNLNERLSESDARLLKRRVEHAIAGWKAAISPAERDFKHALCMLMASGAKLR